MRNFLCLKNLFLYYLFLVIQLAAYAQDDLPETAKTINATLLAEITAQGQKVNAVALESAVRLDFSHNNRH